MENEGALKKLAGWIDDGGMVVFTGAGISTESGLSDFRSPGGIWDRFNPAEFTLQKFTASAETRRNFWRFYHENWKVSRAAKPNRAHLAIAEMEKKGKVNAVVTQNIDELHQAAGSSPEKVLEIHGTMWKVGCLSCGDISPWEDFFQLLEEEKEIENCRLCGGLLKPATVSFGQSLPADVLNEAQHQCTQCKLLLCIGSSLAVYPAARLPEVAKNAGAKLAIVNREPTPLDRIADVAIKGEAGEIMNKVLSLLA
ncbi:MAG: NAD-dependent protein deacylase [Firmicutes bacterium]|nr:NAD-dependent protein deacylase [Bacillota bacterium]